MIGKLHPPRPAALVRRSIRLLTRAGYTRHEAAETVMICAETVGKVEVRADPAAAQWAWQVWECAFKTYRATLPGQIRKARDGR